MNEENINNELFNKNNPFKIPEGYFDDFNSRLFLKIENECENKTRITFWHSWKYKLSVAASIAILALLSYNVYYFMNENKIVKKSNVSITESIDDSELSFVNENHIIDVITSDEKEQSFEGDDIINFLVNDNIDENAIAEAY